MNERKGRITAEYWVSCGMCQDHRPVVGPKTRTPSQQAQNDGWLFTKLRGWICPKCQIKDEGR